MNEPTVVAKGPDRPSRMDRQAVPIRLATRTEPDRSARHTRPIAGYVRILIGHTEAMSEVWRLHHGGDGAL